MTIIDASMGLGASGARKRRLRRRRISPPGDFTAVPVSGTSVSLSWVASTGLYVDGYKIFRNGVEIHDVQLPVFPTHHATSYNDEEVLPETSYTYQLYAYNRFSGQSTSVQAVVTTPSEEPI